MLKTIKNKLLLVIGAAILLSPGIVPAVASAQVNTQTITGGLCAGTNGNAPASGDVTNDSSCGTGSTAGTTFNSILSTVINVFSIIVGGVSVVMIIIGGFRYITSGGNDSGVAGAKNTIIYALIGLVIVALAQIIVHFVLQKAIAAGS